MVHTTERVHFLPDLHDSFIMIPIGKFLRIGFGEGTFFKKFLPRENSIQLLFVLVDFLEVLVGVYLQFAAGCFVAGNDSVRMHLKSGDRPCVVYAAFYAVPESACLVVAADEQENLLGIANGADADGKSGLRNLVGVIAEEAGVDKKGVFGQSAYAGAGTREVKGSLNAMWPSTPEPPMKRSMPP